MIRFVTGMPESGNTTPSLPARPQVGDILTAPRESPPVDPGWTWDEAWGVWCYTGDPELILRCFSIPPPITAETLQLRRRGLLEPDLFSYEWWRQRGVDLGRNTEAGDPERPTPPVD